VKRPSMRAALSYLALFAWGASVQAAPMAPAARAEVDALLTRLQSSGCEFNRNGSWYPGADAKAHLLKKLAALEGKNLVQTAEQFIARGASSSSMSGKSYLVRCAGQATVESAQWLTTELHQMRAAKAASSSR